MSPAHTDFETSDEIPENERCVQFDNCGNGTPGQANSICDDCLSAMRAADANRE